MQFKEFDPEKFTKWINSKYSEYCNGDIRVKVTDYAKFLNNKSQTVSYWLLGKLTQRPSDEQCNNLILKYGYEAYDPLGLPRPSEADVLSQLPPEVAEAVRLALVEVRSSGLNNGKATASPDDVEKIKDILAKHLGRYKE